MRALGVYKGLDKGSWFRGLGFRVRCCREAILLFSREYIA